MKPWTARTMKQAIARDYFKEIPSFPAHQRQIPVNWGIHWIIVEDTVDDKKCCMTLTTLYPGNFGFVVYSGHAGFLVSTVGLSFHEIIAAHWNTDSGESHGQEHGNYGQ